MMISFVVSVFNWINNDQVQAYQKVFCVYLFVTVLVELVAAYLYTIRIASIPLYNYFGVLEFTFYFYMLYNLIETTRFRRIIKFIGFVYPVICILNIIEAPKDEFSSVTYAVGALLVAVMSMVYFYELFRSNKSVVLQREPAFWICSALLFFYCCTFPYYTLTNFRITLSEKANSTLMSLMD
ncbi:MAG: hypothetical protein ABW174_01900, partial [Flavitalea sp.]